MDPDRPLAPGAERRPTINTRLGWPWWLMAALLAGGLWLIATDHLLRATVAIAGALLTGAALRVGLTNPSAGGLRVRGKALDVLVLLVLAVAVVTSGFTLDLNATR